MDDVNPPSPPADFNKIDLSQLAGFSFGTQWTKDKPEPAGSDRGERPRRSAHSEGAGPAKRDRRGFQRPAGGPGESGPSSPAGDRRPAMHDRRRDAGGRGSPRGGEGRDDRGRPAREPHIPYDSPSIAVAFYPEEASFAALTRTVRSSCRTVELFQIARTVLEKPERFLVQVQRKSPAGEAPAAPAAPPAAERLPLFVSVPDGLAFETEEAAIAHVLSQHLDRFFDRNEAEVEPPKGNFQVVNRCGVTGALLGPPNYHRYAQIVQQHYAAKQIQLGFEAYRSRIESVRDPALIQQWLEQTKKVTRYTWKQPAAAAPVPAPAEAAPAEAHATEGEAKPAETPAAAAPVALSFDTIEEARQHLLTQAKGHVVRANVSVRFHGRDIGLLPAGEIRRAVEGALERQRRFPLETANALRGRLRRERFTIFKKGSKGISYICSVRRKFRVPGQVLAAGVGDLISFIEAHPMIKAGELAERMLGLAKPEKDAPAPELSVEQREKIARIHGDLQWLVREGYVTEFIDGSLYAPPPLAAPRKAEAAEEEVDPENFPEPEAAPAAEEAPAEPAEAPAPEVSPEPLLPPEAPAPQG